MVGDSGVVSVTYGTGQSPVVLVCEHAANFIPDVYDGLGLSPAAMESHIAWDPGALGVAQQMSRLLSATLIAGTVSRLVYDCNRPPIAPDAIPVRSEIHDIPGNMRLDDAARADRVATYYDPFRATLADVISAMPDPVIVTVHSFTPVYAGEVREVEIGIVHDADHRLADPMLEAAKAQSPLADVRRNEPYGPAEGVTHTLKEHGLAHGHLNVMLEIRSDLIATPDQQAGTAKMIVGWLHAALERCA